jgi:adenylosuccinate synthase
MIGMQQKDRQMESIKIIVDLQYGSTGKGLIVGYLAEEEMPDTVLTAWAPNAGHTYISSRGRKFIHTHLGNGVVSPCLKRILLGPGSLINPQQLRDEMRECRDLLRDVDVLIHPHAAVVGQRHVDEEAGPMTKIGSTKKGVGAAMIQRIRRDPDDMNIAANCPELHGLVTTVEGYRSALAEAEHVLVEGAQGYGLSMYHGFYPYTTSRDVSTWQILADVGVPHDMVFSRSNRVSIIGTCRTFPIRVANRYDTEGTQVGYSGPCYDDQLETSFEEIGQKTELTTVTKLPRRIFTFSPKQITEAISYNGAKEVFLNFVNYIQYERDLVCIVRAIEEGESMVGWIGTGSTHRDVHPLERGSRSDRMEQIVNIWKARRI